MICLFFFFKFEIIDLSKICFIVHKNVFIARSRYEVSLPYISSTSLILNNILKESQELVKAKLKEQGFLTINYTSSDFNKRDLQLLNVSLQSALLKKDVLPDLPNHALLNGFLEKYILSDTDI